VTRPIRILIIDDHPLLRRGLALLFDGEADLEVVGEAATPAEALEILGICTPDVVLLDINLSGANGIALIHDLRAGRRQIRILIISMYDDLTHVGAAYAAGVDGYVTKSASPTELMTAIRTVARGTPYRNPSLAPRENPNTTESSLSPRESQVLQHLALGFTNHDIATALDVSVKTIETHRARMMSKLNAHSRADLVRHAIARGLLDPDAAPTAPN